METVEIQGEKENEAVEDSDKITIIDPDTEVCILSYL